MGVVVQALDWVIFLITPLFRRLKKNSDSTEKKPTQEKNSIENGNLQQRGDIEKKGGEQAEKKYQISSVMNSHN